MDGPILFLQVQAADGQWNTVQLLDNTVQVIVGEAMGHWTSGRLKPSVTALKTFLILLTLVLVVANFAISK